MTDFTLSRPRPRPRRTVSLARAAHALSRGIIAVSLLPLSLGLYGAKLGHDTRSWTPVRAEIIAQALIVGESDSHTTVSRGRTIRVLDQEPAAALAIRYRYQLDGRTYEASGIERGTFGVQISARARALGHANPVGTRTEVAVNPARPAQAVLSPGVSETAKLVLSFGAALLALGLWLRSLARASGPCVRL